jgi:hypothetical protein
MILSYITSFESLPSIPSYATNVSNIESSIEASIGRRTGKLRGLQGTAVTIVDRLVDQLVGKCKGVNVQESPHWWHWWHKVVAHLTEPLADE